MQSGSYPWKRDEGGLKGRWSFGIFSVLHLLLDHYCIREPGVFLYLFDQKQALHRIHEEKPQLFCINRRDIF